MPAISKLSLYIALAFTLGAFAAPVSQNTKSIRSLSTVSHNLDDTPANDTCAGDGDQTVVATREDDFNAVKSIRSLSTVSHNSDDTPNDTCADDGDDTGETVVATREDDSFNPLNAIKKVAQVVSPLLPGPSLPAPVKLVATIVSKVAPAGSSVSKLAGALAARDDEVQEI